MEQHTWTMLSRPWVYFSFSRTIISTPLPALFLSLLTYFSNPRRKEKS